MLAKFGVVRVKRMLALALPNLTKLIQRCRCRYTEKVLLGGMPKPAFCCQEHHL